MRNTKKILIICLIAISLLLIALKIFAAPYLKKIAIRETEKFIKTTYQSDIKLKIEKLSLKTINLILLKPTILITNLSLGDKVQINSADAEINLYELLKNKNLIFKYLKINKSKILLNRDFNFSGTKKEKQNESKEPYLKKIFFNEISLKELDLIISNENFKEESLEFVNMDLLLNHLEIAKTPESRKTSFNLKSNFRNPFANGHLAFTGNMGYDSNTKTYSYNATGEIIKLDIQSFLRILTGKKQGLSGRLSATDIVFKSQAKEAYEFSKNINITSKIMIKEGSLYLLDYIIKAKQVINTAIPVKAILQEGYELAKDTATRIKNPGVELEKSAKSKNSKFTEFDADLEIKDEKIFLTNIIIETPIMKIKGKGYNTFNNKMKYNLIASLAKVPVLPIIIRTVQKVPVVFIDVHELALEKTQSLLNVLNITDPKDEKDDSSVFSKVKKFIDDKIF